MVLLVIGGVLKALWIPGGTGVLFVALLLLSRHFLWAQRLLAPVRRWLDERERYRRRRPE